MPDGVFERNNAISTLASRPGILGALVRFWSRSYAADYVSLILLCVGLILVSRLALPLLAYEIAYSTLARVIIVVIGVYAD